jgi:DNA-binding response OmpR family regulator
MAAVSLLLVCDRPDVSEITSRALMARGFDVDRADAVDDAVIRFGMHSPPFGCVIIDLESGTAEALKLLDKIRGHTDDTLAVTPVIISTWVEENRVFSWQSGVDGFLVRPYHLDELLELMVGSLERSPDERMRFRQEQLQLAAGA